MQYQSVFKRHELKYLLSAEQKARVIEAIAPHMSIDRFGRDTVRNLYYDTDTFLLIRRSIERPVYKEKLRLRSYGRADDGATVYAELKKKYKSVVYKRRIAMPFGKAADWLAGGEGPEPCQISREIDYFLSLYGTLKPRIFLSYEREAYYCRDGSDFRLTFDENVLCRTTDLSLCSPPGGTPLLEPGTVLMEIKCSGGIPLWMVKILSAEGIRKTSFSKYGKAYETLIYPNFCNIKGETANV